ncbi:MAG: hypothetical protein AAF329_08495 [Cyanobacteria bacterium P01_A01_bin.17]
MVDRGRRRRESYTRQLAQLEEELAAVEADLKTERSGSDRLKLEKKSEQLLDKIEELEEKLDELGAQSDNTNVKDRTFDKVLQKIDFDKAKEIASDVKTSFGANGGGVLFFLQRSTKLMGSYCVEEVLEVLMGDHIVAGKIVADYRRIPVDLGTAISQCNETEFLTLLGSHFNIDGSDDALSLSQQLRKAIRKSIDGGTTVFLEIKGVDDLIEQETFLTWFVDEFWKPLIDEVVAASKKFENKFIVALIADSYILPDCPSTHFCQDGEFDPYKLLELPLLNWTVDDISEWLVRFRSLSTKTNGKTKTELKKIAKKVHQVTEGTPQSICVELKEKWL